MLFALNVGAVTVSVCLQNTVGSLMTNHSLTTVPNPHVFKPFEINLLFTVRLPHTPVTVGFPKNVVSKNVVLFAAKRAGRRRLSI